MNEPSAFRDMKKPQPPEGVINKAYQLGEKIQGAGVSGFFPAGQLVEERLKFLGNFVIWREVDQGYRFLMGFAYFY